MAKTKYIKVESNYDIYIAFQDPDGYGWEVNFDGNRFWISDEGIDGLVGLLKEIKKESK